MKKILRRFGCSTVLAGLSCAAHAQDSGVTLYGVLDSSIQYARSGGKSTTAVDSGDVQPSIWGLKGTESLGGGYSAIFKLEGGINVNNGASTQTGKLFGRESWVGLGSPYGSIHVGLNNTPEMWGLVRFETGDLGHWDWGHAANNYDFFFSTKVANSIYYTSPVVGGLQLSVLWGFGANGDATQPSTLGNTFSAGIYYANGPFAFEADYLSQVYTTASVVTPTSPTSTGNHDLFGVSYDFGIAKIDGLFVLHRGAANVTVQNMYAVPNNYYYEISAQIPHVLNGLVMASFGQYKLQRDSAGDSTSYGLRYDYHLSKTTGLYTGVAYVKNGSVAGFTENGGQGSGLPVTRGHNELATVVGMMHVF
jgi:predicted porin